MAVVLRRAGPERRREPSEAAVGRWIAAGLALIAAITAGAMLMLPQWRPLPWNLYVGTWLPLPGRPIALSFSYDAAGHLFVFVAVAVMGAVLLSPGAWRSPGWRGPLLLLPVLLAFAFSVTTQELVVLYAVWEVAGWIVWLLLRSSRGADEGVPFPRLSYLAGYGLLFAAILALSGGSAGLAGASAGKRVLAVTCLLVAAAGRSGLFPFHRWVRRCSALPAPAIFALVGGIFAAGGPLLIARALQLAGGTWPAEGKAPAMALALAGAAATSILAWQASSPVAALAYAVVADLGIVLAALIAGSPAGLGAGLLLFASNGLALSALAFAPFAAIDDARPLSTGRLCRLTGVLALASLAGVPPLVGFTARWQLLAALWQEGSIAWVAALLLVTMPRTVAVLRAARWVLGLSKPRAPGEDAEYEGPRLSAVLVPGLLVAIFSAFPWLPQRYLVLPAVEAISGLRPAGDELTAFPLLPAAGSGALLLAGLAAALFYVPEARERWAEAGELLRLPHSLRFRAIGLGRMGGVVGVALVALGERVEAVLRTTADAIIEGSGQRLCSWLPALEERHYLAAILLVGIAVALLLAE